MPPKKGGGGPSKKTVEKKKEKIVEDKTFGLKNKKGKKQQTFIKQVTQQVKYGNQGAAKREQEEREKKMQKKEKERERMETDSLFKPVQTQKVSAGADPKSVLCAFFKQGLCKKGDKCKFSHDLSIERKGEKRSLYVDSREELEKDTMDTWDQQKLEDVVGKKHGKENQGPKKTEIVCKHFLDAIDKSVYGWFWVCPNGGDKCHYRHALPPNFVLKKDRKKAEAQEDQITIEDLVERERAALGAGLTKVTLESFLEWKQRKVKEKQSALAETMAKKKADFKAGRMLGVSGRELFQFNPELAMEDGEMDGEVVQYSRPEDDEDEETGEDAAPKGPSFDLTNIGAVASTATPSIPTPSASTAASASGGAATAGSASAAEASAACAGAATASGAAAAIDIDEELFAQEVDVDEDLFQGQDLGDLDLEDVDDEEDGS